MSPSAIIIGAGIGGLTTGCYAQMNGFDTTILEMHAQPGGVCTSWRRGEYTFDGCIHHVAGAGPASRLYRVWQALGALPDEGIHYPSEFVTVEDESGHALHWHTDPDELEAHLCELSPADARAAQRWAGAVRRFRHFDLFGMMMRDRGAIFAALPHMSDVIRWARLNLDGLAAQFSDPFLRRAIPWVQYGFGGIPALINLTFLADCWQKRMGWPTGGSLAFARRIAARYAELGGELRTRAKVAEILVENDRAVGVRLEDGSVERADLVISNADGYATLYGMLGGRYMTPKLAGYYASPPADQGMAMHVSFGVRRDLRSEGGALTLLLDEPLMVGQCANRLLHVERYSSETGMAPEGKGVIQLPVTAAYPDWQALAETGGGRQGEPYRRAKAEVAERVLAVLDRRFPGVSAQVEVTDVASPLTTERYVGSHMGYQTWGIPGSSVADAFKGLGSTLPGLGAFYMVGQWASASVGLSTVALAGRALVRGLCKEAGRRFEE